MNTHENDAIVDLLSRTLHEEAETVDVDPAALHGIRSRLAPNHRRRWWIAGSTCAGLVTAAAVTAVVLIANPGSVPSTAPPAHQPHHPQPTVTHLPKFGPTISPVPAPHAGRFVPGTPTVLMYYLDPTTRTPNGQVQLYVEPHTVSGAAAVGGTGWDGRRLSDAQALVAVREFFTSIPIDLQYTSGWGPGTDATSVTRTGGTTTIALTSTGDFAGDCAKCRSWAPALQALARTAGLQAGDKLALTLNGTPVDSLLGTPLPVTVEPTADVRASIQITSPVNGQTLDDPVSVTGNGNVFEGNVNWELVDSSGSVVDRGAVLTAQGEWRPFRIRLGDLPAGSYTIRCYEASAKDGSTQHLDDKAFTVR